MRKELIAKIEYLRERMHSKDHRPLDDLTAIQLEAEYDYLLAEVRKNAIDVS